MSRSSLFHVWSECATVLNLEWADVMQRGAVLSCMIPELEGPQRGVAAARHQTPALHSVLLRAHGQVMQTNSGPIQLLSAPCLGEQKGCVSLQGTCGDVGKAHPQGHFFWEGFPASIQYFVWIEGVWRHSSSFYCFRNFISIFLRSHQDEGFLIWICNPVVKSDVQTQYYIKGMVQLTIVWCKNLPHQMALTGDDFLWSLAVCFKFFFFVFFFEKEP